MSRVIYFIKYIKVLFFYYTFSDARFKKLTPDPTPGPRSATAHKNNFTPCVEGRRERKIRKGKKTVVPGSFWKSGSIPFPFMSL